MHAVGTSGSKDSSSERPTPDASEGQVPGGISWVRRLGLVLGPALALATFYGLEGVTASGGETLSRDGRATLGVAVLMAVWWLTEALPIEATALVPIALFPVCGIATVKAAAAPYASDVIYLFLGGMILGLAMEKWELHRRIALHVMARVGTRPSVLVLGVMSVTAFVSMWVSNTAAAVMMLPIGMSIVHVVDRGGREQPGAAAGGGGSGGFAAALMLGIAYAASIGGVGTLIGTPPNAVLAGFLKKQYDQELSFAHWLRIGVPAALIFLPLTWLVLTRVAFRVPSRPLPGVAAMIRSELSGLGRIGRAEALTLCVFGLAALAWIFRPTLSGALGLTVTRAGRVEPLLADAGIAILAALALFVLPAGRGARVLAWTDTRRLPWGVLILFGGGLSLADALTAHHVDAFVGACMTGLDGIHPLVLVLVMTSVTVFATEIGSNTAIATTFMPVGAAVASALKVDPALLLYPIAIGASYAFMMPMGTPPNALVFASGRVNIRQMARAGLVLNILSIVVITLLVWVSVGA